VFVFAGGPRGGRAGVSSMRAVETAADPCAAVPTAVARKW
jgi:hypothetical protein